MPTTQEPSNPVPTPPAAPVKQNLIVDYERLHYDKHIEFFKWMVGIAGSVLIAIVGFATYSTYSSVKDYKDDLKGAVNEMKNDVKELKTESVNSINRNREDVTNQINALNKQVSEQIPIIQRNAEALALSEVRRSINEQFADAKLKNLIASTAEDHLKGRVADILEAKIKARTAEIETQTEAIAILGVATDQIRFGDRHWLDSVIKMSKNHSLPIIRRLAAELAKQKAQDYQAAADVYIVDSIVSLPWGITYPHSADSIKVIIKALVDSVNLSADLSTVASAFVALQRTTGTYFKMFDTKQVLDWYQALSSTELDDIRRRILEKRIKFYQ